MGGKGWIPLCACAIACGPESSSPTGGETATGTSDETGSGSASDGATGAGGTSTTGSGEGPGEDAPLDFAGIRTATWDGADGLIGGWDPAAGTGTIEYTLSVESVETGDVVTAVAADVTATVAGLADGEYLLWVEATDESGEADDGGVVLTQLVGDNRLVFRSETQFEGVADVWGEDDIVALAGWESGRSVIVVDTTDVQRPEVIAEVVDEGKVRDLKIGDGLLFASGECLCEDDSPEADAYDGIGLRIFDFTDPSDPILVGTIADPTPSVHNLSYGKDHVFLSDYSNNVLTIYDVSDPVAPVEVGGWDPPRGRVHDEVWIDDRLWLAFFAGFAEFDVSDPSAPTEIFVNDYGSPWQTLCHNAWPAADPRYVLATEEREGGHVEVWDVSGPGSPVVVGDYITDEEHMIHNVLVRGDFAFLAYYWDGIRVLDISDPTAPREVGWYDTFDEDAPDAGDGPHSLVGSLFDGTWGVWPFGPHVAVADMRRGLLMFDHFPEVVQAQP